MKERVLQLEQHGKSAWEASEFTVTRERGGPRDAKPMVGGIPTAVCDQAIVMQLGGFFLTPLRPRNGYHQIWKTWAPPRRRPTYWGTRRAREIPLPEDLWTGGFWKDGRGGESPTQGEIPRPPAGWQAGWTEAMAVAAAVAVAATRGCRRGSTAGCQAGWTVAVAVVAAVAVAARRGRSRGLPAGCQAGWTLAMAVAAND